MVVSSSSFSLRLWVALRFASLRFVLLVLVLVSILFCVCTFCCLPARLSHSPAAAATITVSWLGQSDSWRTGQDVLLVHVRALVTVKLTVTVTVTVTGTLNANVIRNANVHVKVNVNSECECECECGCCDLLFFDAPCLNNIRCIQRA